MSVTDKQEVRDLLAAACNIREYCMLTGKAADTVDSLIIALEPFDGDDAATSENLTSLRLATRDACQEIDDYTLTQILDGKSPIDFRGRKLPKSTGQPRTTLHVRLFDWAKRNWPLFWQRLFLPGIAVMLLLAAMHFTQWTFQANLLLDRLDHHLVTDPYEEVRDLVLVARAIEEQDGTDVSVPAQRVFNQSMNTLRAYHFREKTLRDDTATEVSLFNPMTAISQGLRSIPAELFKSGSQDIPEADPNEETPKLPEDVATAPNDKLDVPPATEVTNVQLVSTEPGAGSDGGDRVLASVTPLTIAPALGGRDNFLGLVDVIATQTGRHPGIAEDHMSARLNLQENAEDLKEHIANANRFFLPMIYGALGAAIFCLVRILTPALADLGPGRAFLRILFGAFAAMTLSMLFIPSNIFTINAQSNSTLVFLACFLFGYSFDAVMTALHRMESLIEGRLKPAEPAPPKSPRGTA